MELLFSQEIISARVRELGGRISSDYKNVRPVLIGVLKGAFIFFSHLVRSLDIDADIDFIQVSSYGSATVSSGTCLLKKDISINITGRHVLLIDDIIDTGLTTAFLIDHLASYGPESVRFCCLIERQIERYRHTPVAYAAFSIGPGYVVGYGLDCDERYRGLPAIYRITEPAGE